MFGYSQAVARVQSHFLTSLTFIEEGTEFAISDLRWPQAYSYFKNIVDSCVKIQTRSLKDE